MTADTVTILTRQVFLGDTAAAGVLADAWEERGDADAETLAVLRALVPLLHVQGPPWPPPLEPLDPGPLTRLWLVSRVPGLPEPDRGEGRNVFTWLRAIGAVERRGVEVRHFPFCATLAVRLYDELYNGGVVGRTELYRPSPRRTHRDTFVAGVFFVPHVEATEVLRRWYLPGAADAVNAFMRARLHEDGYYRRIMPLQPLDDVEVGIN